MQGQESVILIDSGSSHNFILSKVVKSWEIQPEATRPYYVRLEDVKINSAQGGCWCLRVQLGQYNMEGDFYCFKVGGVE